MCVCDCRSVVIILMFVISPFTEVSLMDAGKLQRLLTPLEGAIHHSDAVM